MPFTYCCFYIVSLIFIFPLPINRKHNVLPTEMKVHVLNTISNEKSGLSLDFIIWKDTNVIKSSKEAILESKSKLSSDDG